MAWRATLLTLFLGTIFAVLYRFYIILGPNRPKAPARSRQDANKPTHLLIVLGSGGHTAEMISMLKRAIQAKDESLRLDWNDYTHRTWVVGNADSISIQRAKDFEDMAAKQQQNGTTKDEGGKKALLMTVPRAREIHQSVFTTPISCLRCMMACLFVLLSASSEGRDFPDVILCNGPATATILVFTSKLLRFLNVKGCNARGKLRTVYVESWARVKKLSLSGVLLERVVDRFIVQWPQLTEGGGGGREFLGVLV